MLVSLHVKNLALIQETEVFFGPGLNILTGETGAGKSIILGSVNLALGAKADKDMIRTGEEYALIELVFQVGRKEVLEKIAALDIPVEDRVIILQRRIMPGRSVCKVNGENVNTRLVRELAGMLIDIHGQHDSQILLKPRKHLEILDEFSGEEISDLKRQIRECYQKYLKLQQELKENVLDGQARNRELSLARFELEEISAAALKPGEDEQLEKDYRRMVNGKKIAESLAHVYALTGYENGAGAGELAGRALKELASVTAYDEALEEFSRQLQDIEALLNDFNRGISDYREDMEFDEEFFVETEERLNQINRLKDKYGSSIKEILAYAKKREQELMRLENQEDYLKKLRQELDAQKQKLENLCRQASAIRKSQAVIFSGKLEKALADLNFLHVDFEVRIKEKEMGADGMDDVEFFISTNPGSPRKPLANVASGGELSRIMLALKTVTAGSEDMDVFIFDEIDAGISGRTAWKVSEKLSFLGKDHQIICITHLPQIEAMADNHFVIEKSAEEDSTITRIHEVKDKEVLEELARLLGAETIKDAVLANAKELKDLAAKTKQY